MIRELISHVAGGRGPWHPAPDGLRFNERQAAFLVAQVNSFSLVPDGARAPFAMQFAGPDGDALAQQAAVAIDDRLAHALARGIVLAVRGAPAGEIDPREAARMIPDERRQMRQPRHLPGPVVQIGR